MAGKTYSVHLKINTATSTEGLGIQSSHFKADCEWNHWFVSCLSETFLFLFWMYFGFLHFLFSLSTMSRWTYYPFCARSVKAWIHTVLQELHCLLQMPLCHISIKTIIDAKHLSMWNNESKLLFLLFIHHILLHENSPYASTKTWNFWEKYLLIIAY